MGKLFGYEWYKLGKQTALLLLTAILLAVNLLTVYTSEKYEPTWFYVWEQKENYVQFQAGDVSADIDGFYQNEADQQKRYLESYHAFIIQMSERADRMAQASLFGDDQLYLERNAEKSQQDFGPFQAAEVREDNCFGVRAYANYGNGILFLIVFLGLLTYNVLFAERDSGMLLLLKGCRHGHFALAFAKMGTIVVGAVLYTLLQELSTLLFYHTVYGYGDLSRAIQSVDLFRNCALALTVGEALAVQVLIRMGTAVFIASVFYLAGMLFRSKLTAVVFCVGILGTFFWLNAVLTVNSSLNIFKCIDPFFCWQMQNTLGTYLNLNILQIPVSKGVCAAVVGTVVALIAVLVGIWVFHCVCQTQVESRAERIMLWVRAKTACLGHHTNLVLFEGHKPLVQQKKAVLLLFMVIWCVWSCYGTYQPQYFGKAEDAAYYSYMQCWQGKITPETLQEIQAEQERLDGVADQLAAADETTERFEIDMMRIELERWSDGFKRVQEQIAALEAQGGSIFDLYLVNEEAYISRWMNTKEDVSVWLCSAILIGILVNGLYPLDDKKGLNDLLRSTYRGRRPLRRSKTIVAMMMTMTVFLITQLPSFLAFWEIDHFKAAEQSLTNITSGLFHTEMPMGEFLILIFLMKIAAYLIVGAVSLIISKRMKNEMLANIVTAGMSGIIAVILFQFHLDLTMLLIQML